MQSLTPNQNGRPVQIGDDATGQYVCLRWLKKTQVTFGQLGALALWNKSEPLNRESGERCGDAAGWKLNPAQGAIVGLTATGLGL